MYIGLVSYVEYQFILWKIQQSLVPLEVRPLEKDAFFNYRNKAVYHVDKQG